MVMGNLFVKMMFEVRTEGGEEWQHLDIVDCGAGAACEKALWQGYAWDQEK